MHIIGEFLPIVLKTGKDLNVISDMPFPIIGMVVTITTHRSHSGEDWNQDGRSIRVKSSRP